MFLREKKGKMSMKKSINIVLLLFVSVLFAPQICAKTMIINDVKYKLDDKRMIATYESFVGERLLNQEVYSFPNTVEQAGKKYVVTKIGKDAVKNISAKKIIIPASIRKIDVVSLRDFDVEISLENKSFVAKNNIVYSADKKTALVSGKLNKHVIITEGTRIIEGEAFHGSDVEEIMLPKSVKIIKKNTFSKCRKLKKIVVSSQNPYMLEKNGAIYTKNMKKLLCAGVAQETLLLPKKVKRIAPYSFSGNITVKKVVIPKSVTCLSKRCFAFSNIKEISLPDTLEKIGSQAFRECQQLKQIKIPNNVKIIGKGSFLGCTKLKKIELPNSLKVIEDRLLWNCPSLRKIQLPESLCRIRKEAFKNCGFEKLVIPESVTSIEKNALETTIGTLVFESEIVPKIEDQEVCLFGKNEAGEYPEDVLDQRYNYNIIRGIGIIKVPEKSYAKYKKALRQKIRYQKM